MKFLAAKMERCTYTDCRMGAGRGERKWCPVPQGDTSGTKKSPNLTAVRRFPPRPFPRKRKSPGTERKRNRERQECVPPPKKKVLASCPLDIPLRPHLAGLEIIGAQKYFYGSFSGIKNPYFHDSNSVIP